MTPGHSIDPAPSPTPKSIDTARLTEAVKREWGGKGVTNAEPYITNGAWRAVVAVLAELEAIRKEGGDRVPECESSSVSPGSPFGV